MKNCREEKIGEISKVLVNKKVNTITVFFSPKSSERVAHNADFKTFLG